jgi:hypothetical protein
MIVSPLNFFKLDEETFWLLIEYTWNEQLYKIISFASMVSNLRAFSMSVIYLVIYADS